MKKLKLPIIIFRNVFEKKEEILECDSILRGPGWRFGFKSYVEEEDNFKNLPSWKLQLDDEPFFTDHMFSVIKEITGMNFEILEVYCNGSTYTQDGHPHTDDVHGETHTFLYYANTEWNLTWGGQTVFLAEGQRIGIDPIPNSAILFETHLEHYGEAYNQFCRDLRMTVCYKLKKID